MTGSAGDNTIIVSIDDNEAYKTRIGTITIKDKVSGKSADITVTQGEKDGVLTFSTGEANTTLTIDNEKQEITAEVSVASNYDYTMHTDATWLTYEKIGRNDDGSIKYIFHADPEKLYQAGGYAEQSAAVTFEYQAETRAPGAKMYLVKFAGITPSVVSDIAPVVLEDDGEVYKATAHITSNILWTMGNKPAFASVEYSGGENNSRQYFETNTAITFIYNKAELQIEGETANLTFIDAEGKTLSYSIDVKFPGVGDDYVYLDNTAFELGDNRMHTFEAFGEPDPEMGPAMYKDICLNFQVKAANPDNITFYIVRQNFAGAPIYSTYLDEWGDESSTDMTGYSGWGFVEDPESTFARSNVETITKSLYIKSRGNEWNGSSKEDAERYFSFFAVSSTKYPTFESMFDEEGNLKPELDGKYVICSQKATGSITDFKCPDLTGKTLEVTAAEETLKFKYSGLDFAAEKWGASWTYGDFEIVDGALTDDPANWGTGAIIKSYDFGKFVDGSGEISITIAPNKTGKPRTENYAIYSGMPDFNNAVFTYFTIKQAAE